MSPIPKRPISKRRTVLAFRFSDEEIDKLDKACVRLAAHWKTDKVDRTDAVRAALEMLWNELEQTPAPIKDEN